MFVKIHSQTHIFQLQFCAFYNSNNNETIFFSIRFLQIEQIAPAFCAIQYHYDIVEYKTT